MDPIKLTTSTGFRYDQHFSKTLEKYPLLSSLSATAAFGIPGLAHTNVDSAHCECMTPQGICVAGPYVLITAYCNIRKYREELEKHKDKGQNAEKLAAAAEHVQHKSVIYVLDKETKEHITTLALPDCNHVGGITFDGLYVWVAKDTDWRLSAIHFGDLKRAIELNIPRVPYYSTVKTHCNAIFTITYKDQIWVGNSHSKAPGTMVCFKVNNFLGLPRLHRLGEIELPILAQGAMLADYHGKTILAISVSGGRVNPSKVYRYELPESFHRLKKGDVLKLSDCKDLGALTLPPMMEEITIDPETELVYTQFESASSPYSSVEGNPCKAIVDRVLVSTLYDWFPEV